MSIYKMGIVYKIITDASDGTDRFLIYIGSTLNTLEMRLSSHLTHYKKGKKSNANKILKNKWFDYHIIEKTENLKERERYYIELYSKDTDYIVVNKNRPIITDEERIQKKVEYYNNHRDELIMYHKEYKKRVEYKQQQKQYYETFKNKLNSRFCEKCNKHVSYFSYDKHIKSKKHLKCLTI